jgi:acetyl-CoA C-acetyltransferase
MVDALERAAADASGGDDGQVGGPGRRLLEKLDRLTSVVSFTWRTANPSQLVADRLGLDVPDLVLSATGGAMPQKLVADAAIAIMAGEIEVAAIVGSEAMYSKGAGKKDPSLGATPWTVQSDVPEARRFGADFMPLTELEMARGVLQPISIYPLFENALRAAAGLGIEEHRTALGSLWSSFSVVAATNPYAWITEPLSDEEITLPSAKNRMIAEPYTKLMVANLPVDQGAALIVCSFAAAEAAGVSRDAMVFPLAHAQGDDPHFISDRPDLGRSPAIELVGTTVFDLAASSLDEVAHVDLYSCFPVAVELGANALGLPLDDPTRPLTVTGGLTFGGGPGNNYVTHSIATMVTRLRANPGDLGLITGLSYFATCHAAGLYSTEPPRKPFAALDVQAELDALPRQAVEATLTGPIRVETFTIAHDRDGTPTLATVAVKNEGGVRSWGTISDPVLLEELTGTDLCGRTGSLDQDGIVNLD